MREAEGATYEELVRRLKRRYGSDDQQEKFRLQLKSRKRRTGETLQKLAYDVERLVGLAYPETGRRTRDVLARDSFIEAQGNSALEFRLR